MERGRIGVRNRMASGLPGRTVAAVLGLISGVVYVAVMYAEGDTPLLWYVVLLAAGSALVSIATGPQARARGASGGFLLLVAGFLGILSIGLPALIGGVVAVTSAAVWTPAGDPLG